MRTFKPKDDRRAIRLDSRGFPRRERSRYRLSRFRLLDRAARPTPPWAFTTSRSPSRKTSGPSSKQAVKYFAACSGFCRRGLRISSNFTVFFMFFRWDQHRYSFAYKLRPVNHFLGPSKEEKDRNDWHHARRRSRPRHQSLPLRRSLPEAHTVDGTKSTSHTSSASGLKL